MRETFNAVADLAATARRYSGSVAIAGREDACTYGEFVEDVSRLAAALAVHRKTGRVGILGSRSLAAYVGCAAAAWSGAAYVPLNLKWPPERLARLLKELELDALVVDANGARLLTEEVRRHAPAAIFQGGVATGLSGAIRIRELPATTLIEPVERAATDTAYIVFTSGSTGEPKGVVVSCGALKAYLDNTQGWTGLKQTDRIAEAHDLTFDLSVHNMFLAWRAGASLHLMTQLDMMAPQAFIRSREITCWMSVPTIVNNMRRNGSLKPGLFPSLRLSIFCGEPLATATATDWAAAAPKSVVENIYGPTEGTVVCTRQRLTNPPLETPERGILSIGAAYPNYDIVVRDETGEPVEDHETGEITIASDQLSDGYFKRPDLTEKAFREIEGRRWYFTGDRGYRDAEGRFHHMGRIDNQVKLKGNRVELEEVEVHLRRASATDMAVVVAWPIVDGSAQGLVAFIASERIDEKAIRATMSEHLPDYMIPARFVAREDLPRNINDKIDRKALLKWLDAEGGTTVSHAPSLVPGVDEGIIAENARA